MLSCQRLLGSLAMVQAVAKHGQLIAHHASVRLKEGVGGGAAIKRGISVDAAQRLFRLRRGADADDRRFDGCHSRSRSAIGYARAAYAVANLLRRRRVELLHEPAGMEIHRNERGQPSGRVRSVERKRLSKAALESESVDLHDTRLAIG